MELEKLMTYLAVVVAGLMTLVFLLDLALGMPFGRISIPLDVLFLIGGGFILWQGVETIRELS